jgi:Uncharacterized conserved protein (DUF2075)
MPALYMDPLWDFLDINPEQLLGRLTSGLAKEGFDTTTLTTFSWQREIAELQEAFRHLLDLMPSATRWPILFEYVLPIIGQRVDCVLLADDMIYVIEYKGGSSASPRAALQQAQEYALNLVDFHEASRRRTAIPIAVGAFKTYIPLDVRSEHQGAAVSLSEFPDTIVRSHRMWGGKSTIIEPTEWNNSRYFPVPTIIQAASAIYRNHDVKDLASSRAGTDNLETTQKAVAKSVRDAMQRGVKKLLVITGVPGAGKTLAGLNAVQLLAQELDLGVEQASFLSGNGPLVAVIQEALKRTIGSRKKGAARSVRSRVREVHRFVRDSYGDSRPPADRLIVFDEAQRAWTAAKNFKKFERDVSEPEMVLEIMGRHEGWSVIVALVGGGQEIHGGEAGLAAWGDAITKHPEWEVITSPEAVLGGPSVAGSRLFREGYSATARIEQEPALHLAISKRSYETDITAAWVNAVLDGRAEESNTLAARGLPVHLTRDIQVARSWLWAEAKGNRRAGLVASSGAARLRADGVETPTFNFLKGIDYVKWFLEPAGDHRSSNQLEVALSEFEMQGLEVDVAGLLWGGDLVFPEERVVARSLRGRKWCVVSGIGDPQASADDPRTRIQNKYRVLLTRFRKGMVIFVPMGSTDDPTRAPGDFDGVYRFLLRCGVHPLG